MKYWLLVIIFVIAPTMISEAAVNNSGGGLGYTCTDNPGEKRTCTCSGAADCWWMGRSGVCEGEVIVLTCGNDGKCTCDWKRKAIILPGARLLKSKENQFILQIN